VAAVRAMRNKLPTMPLCAIGQTVSGGVGRGFARAPEINVETKGTTYRMGRPVREAGTPSRRLAALHATSRVGENGDRDG